MDYKIKRRVNIKLIYTLINKMTIDDALSPYINTNHPSYKKTKKQLSIILQKVASLSYQMKLSVLVSIVLISLLSHSYSIHCEQVLCCLGGAQY
jgi:hypothetical protein